MTRVLQTIAETRALLDKEREAGRTIGFVPTMGFLHEGHASLMRRARAETDVVLVSIFVNPTQFGPNEDFAAYPRDLERDLALCERERVDVVFHPDVEEMYGARAAVSIDVGEIGTKLCGRTRPGHFNGVATVVTKLFNIAGPCRAYFGEKDFQQVAVIRSVVRALDQPVEVIGCPTVREPDGVAMSSRNSYLGPEERRAATVLKRALDTAAALAHAGEREGARLVDAMRAVVEEEPLARLDYASCVDPVTLDDAADVEGAVTLAIAAWVGKARLIDNMTVTPDGASIEGGR